MPPVLPERSADDIRKSNLLAASSTANRRCGQDPVLSTEATWIWKSFSPVRRDARTKAPAGYQYCWAVGCPQLVIARERGFPVQAILDE
jgi:hypothetical protein